MAAADEILDEGESRLTLSSGIVLELRPVPPFAIRQAGQAVPKPEMPTYWDEKLQAFEDNPNDPEYAEAVADYDRTVYESAVNLSLIMGTEVLEVPEGMVGPDANEWLEDLEAAGVVLDVRTASRRKLHWLNYYALRLPADITAVTARALQRAGLGEAEIALAISSFLSNAGWRADTGSDSDAESQDGDPVPQSDSGVRP
jgi:hypothetical protein